MRETCVAAATRATRQRRRHSAARAVTAVAAVSRCSGTAHGAKIKASRTRGAQRCERSSAARAAKNRATPAPSPTTKILLQLPFLRFERQIYRREKRECDQGEHADPERERREPRPDVHLEEPFPLPPSPFPEGARGNRPNRGPKEERRDEARDREHDAPVPLRLGAVPAPPAPPPAPGPEPRAPEPQPHPGQRQRDVEQGPEPREGRRGGRGQQDARAG